MCAEKCQKIYNSLLSDVFFQAVNYKNFLQPGFHPRPCWWGPLVGWGGGPPPHTFSPIH